MNNSYLLALYKNLVEIPEKTIDMIIEQFYSNYLKAGDFVVDVGANTGRHTITMAKLVAPGGRIIAFEPVSENVVILKKCMENQQLTSIIDIREMALSNFSGQTDFHVFINKPGYSTLKVSPFINSKGMEKEIRRVPVQTLDKEIPPSFKVKFVKIDTEGGDFLVLQGAAEMLGRDKPVVIFESWEVKANPARLCNYSKEEFLTFFHQLNYKLYDTMGLTFREELWQDRTMNDLIAIPEKDEKSVVELLRFSILEITNKQYLNSKVKKPVFIGTTKVDKTPSKRKNRKKPPIQTLLEESPHFHGNIKAGSKNYSMTPEMLWQIFDFLRTGSITLEIGCGYSTIVMALAGNQHTVISPYPQEHTLIKQWCLNHNIPLNNVEFIIESSQDVTPRLSLDQSLDMILLDGESAFPIPLLDWYYTADWLKEKGYLVLAETSRAPGKILKDFLISDKKRWRMVYQRNRCVIFQKRVPSAVAIGIPWIHQPYVINNSEIDKRFVKKLLK